jgi:hypothetical protein
MPRPATIHPLLQDAQATLAIAAALRPAKAECHHGRNPKFTREPIVTKKMGTKIHSGRSALQWNTVVAAESSDNGPAPE